MIFQRRLTADWRAAHKWGSIRLKALAAGLVALQQGWPNIPEAWKGALPASVPHWLGYAAIASIGGAAYAQLTKSRYAGAEAMSTWRNIAAQVGKIGETPAFITAMAHMWFAFSALAIAARYGLTLWVAVPVFVVLAAGKEFVFDLKFETTPPQTVFMSAEDFAEYMLGVLLSIVVIH